MAKPKTIIFVPRLEKERGSGSDELEHRGNYIVVETHNCLFPSVDSVVSDVYISKLIREGKTTVIIRRH